MLSAKQKKCIELMLQGELSQKEIASAIKVSENTICNWKKDNEFTGEYDNLIKSSIKTASAKAFHTQLNLLKSKSDMVKYMTSKDILDRAGFKPDDKININGMIPVVISGGDELED